MNKQGLSGKIKLPKTTRELPDAPRHAWGWGAAGLLVSLFFAVILFSGCASTQPNEANYNPVTSYPAVGDRQWHL